mmetsp:Transcript_6936/g.10527  ORF Transcript_6936/g.10527 Transcript_6936/m.10527 type:complete len:204 (+) Transcript_6936:944-1555(+)
MTTKVVLWTSTAVVWPLRSSWCSTLRPTKRSSLVKVEKSKFLLHSKPNFLVFISFEFQVSLVTGVGRKRISCRCVSITHNKNVVNTIITWAERISENTAWVQDHLRVIPWCLVRRATIKVPLWKSIYTLSLFRRESAGFRTSVTLSILPNILGQNNTLWVFQGSKFRYNSRVQLALSCFSLKNFHVYHNVALILLRIRWQQDL